MTNLLAEPVNTPITSETSDIITTKTEKQAEKYEIAKALLESNVKQTSIAKLLNYTPEHITRIKPKLLKNQLVTSKTIKLAAHTVKHFADVKNYESDDRIKPSDALRASEIILNRAYPVINVSMNKTEMVNIDVSCDMSKYLNVINPTCEINHTPLPIDIDKLQEVVEIESKVKSLISNEV